MPEATRASELLGRLPRYKSGRRLGRIKNDRLREIEKLLSWYTFNDQELDLIEKEIEASLKGGADEHGG